MSGAFRAASAVERRADGVYACRIPDGWQQGRGAFGGLVLGVLARAMDDVARAHDGAPRTLRSLTGDLCGPALPGEGAVTVTTLRRGKGMTFLDARLEQPGGVVARASAAFAASRGTRTPAVSPPAPDARPWRDVPVFERLGTGAPDFTAHYEYRPTGPLPFAGSAVPACAGWVRERAHDGAPLDTPAVLGLVDAWWPAVFSIEPAPRPMATVTFTFELLADASELPGDEPLQFASHAVVARDGLFVEFRELWAGGRPVAFNQQTFAILG